LNKGATTSEVAATTCDWTSAPARTKDAHNLFGVFLLTIVRISNLLLEIRQQINREK